jgi:hypothetical protein
MSRSRKLPIHKDSSRSIKKTSEYWRTVRRIIKSKVRFYSETIDDEILPIPKEIINDYDYCDWIYDSRFVNEDDTEDRKKWAELFSRK